MKILIMDDIVEHTRDLSKYLLENSYNAIGKTSWIDSLSLWNDWHPHMLICSAFADGRAAWKVCREIRSNRCGGRPYILVLSNKFDRREKALCMEFGADEYHEKPISEYDLLACVINAADGQDWG